MDYIPGSDASDETSTTVALDYGDDDLRVDPDFRERIAEALAWDGDESSSEVFVMGLFREHNSWLAQADLSETSETDSE